MIFTLVSDEGLAVSTTALLQEVRAGLLEAGHLEVASSDPNPNLVLHATTLERARASYIRANPSIYVATLVDSEHGDAYPAPQDLQKQTYVALVKTMSNVVVHRVRDGRHGGRAYFVTPELGFRSCADDTSLPHEIVDYVTPLAAARVVIANRPDEDLPRELWEGDSFTAQLVDGGRRLAAMNLLPTAFNIKEVLDERDLRLVMKIFGLKQLSYGNLSVRRDATTFWMTGRGVDKSKLERIGHDMLLVKGYDPETATILLSQPAGADSTARVSVDAIEHYKIYRAVPGAGAIVHVHAWMEGIDATLQSWPCGTEQLADEVLDLVLRAPDPARAVVGLKNHGLTITGHSIPEIFARIEGRLTQDIPAV